MKIYRLIYRSTATRPLSSAELERLVSQAQIYNFSHQVTGLLFYANEQFLQVLEGSEMAVGQVYERLRHDERHAQLAIIDRALVPARLFSRWSMGFGEVDARALDWLASFLDPKSRMSLLPSSCDAQAVTTDLLEEFVEQQLLIQVRPADNGGGMDNSNLYA